MIGVPQKPEANLPVGTHNARLVVWLALTAIGGIVYFFAAVAVLHVLRPEYNPMTHAVSNYVRAYPLTERAPCMYNSANMKNIDLQTQPNHTFNWYFYFSPPA